MEIKGRHADVGAEGIRGFVDLLASINAPPLLLAVGKKRPTTFSFERLENLFKANADRVSFRLGRDRAPHAWFHFVISPNSQDGRAFAMGATDLSAELFATEELARRFSAALGKAFSPFHVIVGHCHSMTDLVATPGPRVVSDWEPGPINEAYWLNWYGAELVERIGRSRVLATPADSLQELADGSVVWTTRPGPTDYASDVSRQAQARARAHIVDGVSYERELERLRERSRQIAPVEPSWDPELDAVFSLIADVPASGQAELVAELNALEVPPVGEYRAGVVTETDVDEPARALEEYEMHAEHLIALLHDKVENIGSFDPADLPKLDAHFWRYRYPERFDAEEVQGSLVPAVGGYIGELLVRRFGGRWVPRENIDEAAVVVGDRAWLPFARARKYLARREGAVLASMTKFVREVERHGDQP